ncbi:hypothetical protein Pmani_001331 [Petrolisthes manimaculis]|uniref:C1q domain-containing protein n=1 Tax=Petrolisthes manimaculis TaxID=1843537 RepID=A0AAE1QKQ6_9EUCA|nr:hypothetical protein Pmani_001331 [Petrolisthes manimaculis]
MKMMRVVLVALVAVLGWQQVAGQQVAAQDSPQCTFGSFYVERAKPNSGSDTITPGKIEFLNVENNDGGWSPTTNEFTAPCSGIFTFSFAAKSSERFGIQLIKNQEVQVTVHGNRLDPLQESININLEMGDRIYLYLLYGIIIEPLFNEIPNTYFRGEFSGVGNHSNVRLVSSNGNINNNCTFGSFSVERAKPNSGPNSIIGPSNIEFLNVENNDGGWSPTTNEFTAPCSGIFTFSFAAKSSERFGIQLLKNNRIQVIAYGSYLKPVNVSANLNLIIGDTLYLYLDNGIIYETTDNEAPNTYFKGVWE